MPQLHGLRLEPRRCLWPKSVNRLNGPDSPPLIENSIKKRSSKLDTESRSPLILSGLGGGRKKVATPYFLVDTLILDKSLVKKSLYILIKGTFDRHSLVSGLLLCR